MPTAKELKIKNYNNCLLSDVFITIGIAPPREKIPARHIVEGSLFFFSLDDEKIFIRCIDIFFVKFKNLTDHFTLWAYGKNYDEYKAWWLSENTDTTDDTIMIVCYYRKEKF